MGRNDPMLDFLPRWLTNAPFRRSSSPNWTTWNHPLITMRVGEARGSMPWPRSTEPILASYKSNVSERQSTYWALILASLESRIGGIPSFVIWMIGSHRRNVLHHLMTTTNDNSTSIPGSFTEERGILPERSVPILSSRHPSCI